MNADIIISNVKEPSIGIRGKIFDAKPEKPAEILICEFPIELASSLKINDWFQ